MRGYQDMQRRSLDLWWSFLIAEHHRQIEQTKIICGGYHSHTNASLKEQLPFTVPHSSKNPFQLRRPTSVYMRLSDPRRLYLRDLNCIPILMGGLRASWTNIICHVLHNII